MRAFTFLRLSPEMTSPAYQVRPAPPQSLHCLNAKWARELSAMGSWLWQSCIMRLTGRL